MLPAKQACTKLRDTQIARTLSDLHQSCAALRRSHEAVGLVPENRSSASVNHHNIGRGTRSRRNLSP